jgi:hypothetical protein
MPEALEMYGEILLSVVVIAGHNEAVIVPIMGGRIWIVKCPYRLLNQAFLTKMRTISRPRTMR